MILLLTMTGTPDPPPPLPQGWGQQQGQGQWQNDKEGENNKAQWEGQGGEENHEEDENNEGGMRQPRGKRTTRGNKRQRDKNNDDKPLPPPLPQQHPHPLPQATAYGVMNGICGNGEQWGRGGGGLPSMRGRGTAVKRRERHHNEEGMTYPLPPHLVCKQHGILSFFSIV